MEQLFCCLQVDQSNLAIKENFGKFEDLSQDATFSLGVGSTIAGHLSLRVQQLDVRCETKTKDNVFVVVVASVQYCALPENAISCFLQTQHTKLQTQSYVFDVIRASVPKLNLDTFEQKNEIAKVVEDEIEKAMSYYGYKIIQTFIVDIEPDERLK